MVLTASALAASALAFSAEAMSAAAFFASASAFAFAAALACFVCINFFFLQPYYSLRVAEPREVLDLLVFIVVGTIAGRLGASVRQRAEDARVHRRRSKRLALGELRRHAATLE